MPKIICKVYRRQDPTKCRSVSTRQHGVSYHKTAYPRSHGRDSLQSIPVPRTFQTRRTISGTATVENFRISERVTNCDALLIILTIFCGVGVRLNGSSFSDEESLFKVLPSDDAKPYGWT